MNLINGKLKESSNKISFIANGSNIEIPINGYDFEEKSNLDNKEVFFGIRPEHVFFKKSNESDFEITLKADLSEYIGHEQIMTFDYENQEILAKFPSTIKIDLSKNTKLFFGIGQISLFDAKTEERI
jgi:multiple sugar transport system ATP-binding protein